MKQFVLGKKVAPIRKKCTSEMDVFSSLGHFCGSISEKEPGVVFCVDEKFFHIFLSNGSKGKVEKWSVFVVEE